jgi:hypothetical protein
MRSFTVPRLVTGLATAALVICGAALARGPDRVTPAAAGNQSEAAVAFDGTNYLVVWQDTRLGASDIYATRVSPSGTVLDPGGFPISVAPDFQGSPAVAFDGANYFVFWEDQRAGSPNWDIYGARVTPAGTVLEPGGIPISTYQQAQLTPAVAFDGTNYMVVWSD